MPQDTGLAARQDAGVATPVVAVVGAGRVGAEVVRSLERMGVQSLEVFEADAGAAQALRGRHAVHEGDFWDELTLARLGACDYAICTVDDALARRRLNQKCLVASVNLLQVWTEGTRAVVAAYPFGALPDCACAECDTLRPAKPHPLASLRLSVGDARPAVGAGLAVARVAGTLATALLARIAAGSHGAVARRATLDTSTGEGESVALRRDPACRRCGGLDRPVPVVQTRNRWDVSSLVRACPDSLQQTLRLSDSLEDARESFRVAELVERYRGGPVPAKFALARVGGRTICLDFEEFGSEG